MLIGFLVLLPDRHDWPVPATLTIALSAVSVVGVLLMVIGATGLGRGLTAMRARPRHKARTGACCQDCAAPIPSGLLLMMASFTAASGSGLRLLSLGALFVLLSAKARWEERRLSQRFEGYAEYAARTPRFLPVRWRRRT